VLTITDVVVLGVFLSVALLGVGLWTRRRRAVARALADAGRAEEAQAVLDRLDALTPAVVLGCVAVATLLLVA
jgi:hypothetical protein